MRSPNHLQPRTTHPPPFTPLSSQVKTDNEKRAAEAKARAEAGGAAGGSSSGEGGGGGGSDGGGGAEEEEEVATLTRGDGSTLKRGAPYRGGLSTRASRRPSSVRRASLEA